MGRASILRGEAHRNGRGFRWASRRRAAFDPPYLRFSYTLSALRWLLAPKVGPKYIVQLEEPEQDVEKVPFLEVRNRQGRALVTVIEMLNPSNKRAGDDREQYLAKRRELLRCPARLVEIDLLRAWTPMPQEGRPECRYYEHFISGGEPESSLSANDTAWARQFVPARA